MLVGSYRQPQLACLSCDSMAQAGFTPVSGVSKFRLGSSGDEITTCLKLNKNVPELRIGGVTTKLTTVSRPFVSETFSSCAQKC